MQKVWWSEVYQHYLLTQIICGDSLGRKVYNKEETLLYEFVFKLWVFFVDFIFSVNQLYQQPLFQKDNALWDRKFNLESPQAHTVLWTCRRPREPCDVTIHEGVFIHMGEFTFWAGQIGH